METFRLGGKRWFGRVVRAEIACPGCGKVAILGIVNKMREKRRGTRGWSERIQRFECVRSNDEGGCGGRWWIGLLAWRVKDFEKRRAARDQVPTVEESRGLWEEMDRERRVPYKNLEISGMREGARSGGREVNVIVRTKEEGIGGEGELGVGNGRDGDGGDGGDGKV